MVVVTVMVGTLLVGLDRTVIQLAVPDIIADFDLSIPTSAWLATSYIIADSVFIPAFGKLGDMVGDRRVYTWGMAGFLVTSVLCGLAWNFESLLVFRVLQGLLGAATFPTGLALITKAFEDPGKRTQAFGLFSASFAVSLALGPLVGGPLIDNLSWRWIFYMNFPIALFGVYMVGRFIAADRQIPRLRAFDWQGAVLMGIGLTAIVLVLERGREWGWGSAGALICYVAAALAFAWFIAWEREAREPMVDLRMFRVRALSVALLVSFTSFIAMVGAFFLVPVFAQQMLGYNATEAGLLMLPMAIVMFLAAPIAAKATADWPMWITVSTGMALTAAGLSLLTRVDIHSSAASLALPFVLLSIGLSPSFAVLTLAATGSVPTDQIGTASGMLNLARNMGAAVGIALLATILDDTFYGNVRELATGTTVNEVLVPSIAGALPLLVASRAQVDAYSVAFAVAAGVMLLSAVMGLFSGRSSAKDFGGAGGAAAAH